jgi:hypothetical protein
MYEKKYFKDAADSLELKNKPPIGGLLKKVFVYLCRKGVQVQVLM